MTYGGGGSSCALFLSNKEKVSKCRIGLFLYGTNLNFFFSSKDVMKVFFDFSTNLLQDKTLIFALIVSR